jgi:hypothetical protein
VLSRPRSTVAFAAVNRFSLARLERYLAFFAALSTCGGKHLSRRLAGAFCVVPRRTTRLTAIETPLRLVAITLGSEKLLLPGCKSEWVTAIGAIDLFVLVGHWLCSSIFLLVSRVIQLVGGSEQNHCGLLYMNFKRNATTFIAQ